MNTAWNGCVEPDDVEIGLEGVDLATVGVAAHRDVEDAEAALVVATVEDLGGQQDQPGAGAEDGQPVVEARRQRIEQP